jgi:iron complex outermembrane receptor protein
MKIFAPSRTNVLACTGSLIAITLATSAWAQNDPSSDQRSANSVEEIVVTAQKREQSLQDVPVAVTAVSQATLQVNRVQSVNDLTGLAPGLMSRQNPGTLGSPSFSMRGVFASASAPSQDREISIYQDGAYIGGNRGAVFDLPDIQRIEVLRGPQGTLFGRNATAGAISIVTRDPTGVFGFRQDFTIGNYSQFRTRTTIDTPQFGSFSGYLTYVHDKRRGDVRNLGAGTLFDRTSPFTSISATRSPAWLGGHKNDDVLGAIKFQPNDDFKMVYKFDYAQSDITPEARAINVVNPNSFIGNLLTQVIASQPANPAFGPVILNPQNRRPKATNNAWDQLGYAKAYGHNLTTEWRISDKSSLKNVTAYRYSRTYGPASVGGLEGLQFTQGSVLPYAIFAAASSVPNFATLPAASQGAIIGQFAAGLQPAVGNYFGVYEGNNYGYVRQESSETQLNYDAKRLTATVGVLWYHSFEKDSGLPGYTTNFSFQPLPTLLPLGNLQNGTSKATSIAAYAQGEFHITSSLDLVSGGRITKDKKVAGSETGGTFSGTRTTGTIVGTTVTSTTFTKTKPTFSVGVNYKPQDDVLLYAKYSSAFLSGGIVGPLEFKPETVKSVELGLKSEFFDHRMRANLAVYDTHYRHSQSAQSGSVIRDPSDPSKTLQQYGVIVIDNGPLHAKGAELEVTATPVEGVTLGGSAGYTDAKLTRPNPLIAQGQPYKLGGVPKWIGSTYAQYETHQLFRDATLAFRLDANYQGKFRNTGNTNIRITQPAFAPYEFTKARWILNGRVTLRDVKIGAASAEVGAWVRNLTNNKDALYTILFGDFLVNSSYQPARTYGLDLVVKFQ